MSTVKDLEKEIIPIVLRSMKACDKEDLQKWHSNIDLELRRKGLPMERVYMLNCEQQYIDYLLKEATAMQTE